MLIAAGGSLRTRPVFAALTLMAAVTSVLLALQIGGPDTGWWQRGWLLVNTGWLAWFMTTSGSLHRSRARVAKAGQGSRGRGRHE